MLTPKHKYLRDVHTLHQSSVVHRDSSREPSFYSETREHRVHAQMMHDLFAGKIDMSVGEWSTYLDKVVKDRPEHNYAIKGREVTPGMKDDQEMVALLAGQASGKSALKTVLENNGKIDKDHSITVSTSFFLNRFPELEGVADINERENKIASVRNEILYLQKLATNIALANGLSAVLDVHIIEEKQAQDLVDIAHKNQVPTALISPHVTLETYGRRVTARSKKEGRDAFKPEHLQFHQIFTDNFENHFKQMFDMSLLMDNNKDITAQSVAAAPNEEALKPIYSVVKLEHGGIHEEVFDAKAYADFKAKIHIHPQEVQDDIDVILGREGALDGKLDKINTHIRKVSESLPRESAGPAESTGAEREGGADIPKHNRAFQRLLELQKPSGWQRE